VLLIFDFLEIVGLRHILIKAYKIGVVLRDLADFVNSVYQKLRPLFGYIVTIIGNNASARVNKTNNSNLLIIISLF